MCLFLYDEGVKKKVATEDIVVYKLLSNSWRGLVAPFMGTPYVLGQLYGSDFEYEKYSMDSDVSKNTFKDFPCPDNTVTKGLHSFASLDDASNIANYDDYPRVICKAVIPAGSEYYEGIWYNRTYKPGGWVLDNRKSLVSNQLIVLEVIG